MRSPFFKISKIFILALLLVVSVSACSQKYVDTYKAVFHDFNSSDAAERYINPQRGLPQGMAIVIGRAHLTEDPATADESLTFQSKVTLTLAPQSHAIKAPYQSLPGDKNFTLDQYLRLFLVPAGYYYISRADSMTIYRSRRDNSWEREFFSFDPQRRQAEVGGILIQPGEVVSLGNLISYRLSEFGVRFIITRQGHRRIQEKFARKYPMLANRLTARDIQFTSRKMDGLKKLKQLLDSLED